MGRSARDEFTSCQEVVSQDCQLSAFMDEEPIHKVVLDAFSIDKTEVTNALYKDCEDQGVCDPPQDINSNSQASYYGNPAFDDYPVIYVTWDQAKTYCEWRGGRLPTEAEWEKAARSADGRTYPWGETIDDTFANFNYGIGDTTAVGSYENGKSPYGVYDMAGNVWEWVADWYSDTYYQRSPAEIHRACFRGYACAPRRVMGAERAQCQYFLSLCKRSRRYQPGPWLPLRQGCEPITKDPPQVRATFGVRSFIH